MACRLQMVRVTKQRALGIETIQEDKLRRCEMNSPRSLLWEQDTDSSRLESEPECLSHSDRMAIVSMPLASEPAKRAREVAEMIRARVSSRCDQEMSFEQQRAFWRNLADALIDRGIAQEARASKAKIIAALKAAGVTDASDIGLDRMPWPTPMLRGRAIEAYRYAESGDRGSRAGLADCDIERFEP